MSVTEGPSALRPTVASGDRLTCHSYASFDGLTETRKGWDDFIESIHGEIFLSFDWCRIWWKHYGKNRELLVLIYKEGTRIVGILPLFFERIRLGLVSLKAVKFVGSDHTLSQFGIPVDAEHIGPVMKALRVEMSARAFDVFHVGPIAGAYASLPEAYQSLMEAFEDAYAVTLRKTNVQTYYKLAGDFDAQLAGLSKNERINVKQVYSKLDKAMRGKGGVARTKLANQDEVDESFDLFAKMHQAHWKKLGKAGHFGDWPGSYEFHRELARTHASRDRLRLLVCRWGDYELGYEYIYTFGGMYLQFLNARSDLELFRGVSLGKYTEMEMFKMGIEERIGTIDSMRGRYEYKLRMGGALTDIHGIYLTPRRGLARAKAKLFRLFARLLDTLYYKIWYCRLAPKLPFRRRPLWEIWIRSQL